MDLKVSEFGEVMSADQSNFQDANVLSKKKGRKMRPRKYGKKALFIACDVFQKIRSSLCGLFGGGHSIPGDHWR